MLTSFFMITVVTSWYVCVWLTLDLVLCTHFWEGVLSTLIISHSMWCASWDNANTPSMVWLSHYNFYSV